jgi:hypothetical protein
MGSTPNIRAPAGGDGSLASFNLIGLVGRLPGPRKQPLHQTVPETDTGGLVEHTKALERTMLKELGNLPP